MDPRIKEILKRNDFLYNRLKDWINADSHNALDLYDYLLNEYKLAPDELPIETRTNLADYNTDIIDIETEDNDQDDENLYCFEFDNDEEELTSSGIQQVFEVARALGDSDRTFQVRYLFVVFRNKSGITAPRRAMAMKIKQDMSLEEENHFRKLMGEISELRPTKILLFRLIKLRT